ncbi:hypothetical protein GCM10020369_18950 [Cryptosporangium minutisporangium]|uniref:Transposase n=1 Tax=Cryptosporangium minutisporangium TaxID=113569 RepID=A0ABP6STV8_9ACTN
MSNGTRDFGLLLGRLNHRMTVLGDRLFRRQDDAARAAGWQISRLWWGLGRRYRDPRIARRARSGAVRPKDEAAPPNDGERAPVLVGAAGRRVR